MALVNTEKRICSIEGCDKAARTRGWCTLHYQRWRAHGDPEGYVGIGIYARPPRDECFWAKVAVGDSAECWEWQANRVSSGYGLFARGTSMVRAHRMAYVFTHGPIPDGLYVLHRCDNPPCCNPAHLFLGTAKDNTADMIAKGRRHSSAGESSARAKLTWENVLHIRCATEIANAEMARLYSVDPSTISQIRARKRWTRAR